MIVGILILSFLIRLINLNQSLWLDEAINVVYASRLDLWSYLTSYSLADFHPPGWFLVLWLWGHIFGFSEVSVRMPSVIFGVLTIYVTYLIGKKLFSLRTGLIAALFLALSPLHIYYSQEARMYSLAAFAVASSVYFLFKLIDGDRKAVLFYLISLILLLYSDYVALLILPFEFIFGFIKMRRKLKPFIFSWAIAFLVFTPWLILFPKQLENGQMTASVLIGWQKVVGGHQVKDLVTLFVKIFVGRISFTNKFLYFAVISAIALPYLLLLLNTVVNFKKWLKDRNIFILSWLILPILLGFFISFFIPIFSYFRFLFILPAFYLLVALFLNESNYLFKNFVIFLIILGEVICSALYLINPLFHREDWRSATAFIKNTAAESSLIVFEDKVVPAPFQYYGSSMVKDTPGLKRTPANSISDINLSPQQLGGISRIYQFEYLVQITDPDGYLVSKIKELGFSKKQTLDFRGVGFVNLYER